MRTLTQPTSNQAFAAKLQAHGPACTLLAKTIAQQIGVPYHEDRLVERFYGHRMRGQPETPFLEGPRYGYEGQVYDAWPNDPETGKPAEMHRVQFLTEEVWGRDFWPNTADTVTDAIRRLPDGKITGIYYHGPSMCIVLMHPGGVKVGIRATSIIDPRLGTDKAAMKALGNLKKWEDPK